MILKWLEIFHLKPKLIMFIEKEYKYYKGSFSKILLHELHKSILVSELVTRGNLVFVYTSHSRFDLVFDKFAGVVVGQKINDAHLVPNHFVLLVDHIKVPFVETVFHHF